MDIWRSSIILVVLVLEIVLRIETKKLSEYITHYETLDYDIEHLERQHQRARRSIESAHVNLKFHAHGRPFHLRLVRGDHEVFSEDLQVDTDGDQHDFDTSFIYTGQIIGEPGSKVFGSVIGKVFAGRITSPRYGNYYVERANKYFKDKQNFHSVIYHGSHIDPEPKSIRDKKQQEKDETGRTCGHSDPKTRHWMQEVANSAQDTAKHIVYNNVHNSKREKRSLHNIYSEEANRKRSKRAVTPLPKHNTCNMYLQSDPLLYEEMLKQNGGDNARTKEEIAHLFSSHIDALNTIYTDTEFTDKSTGIGYKGVRFRVDRVKINTTAGCSYNPDIFSHPFCQKYVDVSNFLNLNSLYNHDAYCLAYVFTYRDFTGGTLGLAWVGSAVSSSGGICEKYKAFTEVLSSGERRTVQKSLNTGIITLINYGQHVPPRVSTLTFAHEVGHNFGSNHDPSGSCAPGGQAGNYIMFASATTGEKSNNRMFSPCSTQNISKVIHAVVDGTSRKTNCFQESQGAFCGNAITEDGEECDCGFKQDCDVSDKCCYGRVAKNHDNNCKLKSGMACSPFQGPCCTAQCELIQASKNVTCQKSEDCHGESKCAGLANATCPNATAENNNTPCNKDTKVCKKGECRGSICEKIDWQECLLSAKADDSAEKRKSLCFVSCQQNNNSDCWSTYDNKKNGFPAEMKKLIGDVNRPTGIKLAAGAPCDDYKGYCDVFQVCRGVDADGPLARLKNLLFNVETLNTIKEWIITYWWGVILIGIGLILFMAAFIKFCAVHTPSSNPKKPPARRISDTLRRRSRQPRGPPPPYSSAPSGGPPRGRGKRQEGQARDQGQGQGPSSGQAKGQGQNKGKQRSTDMEMKGKTKV